MTTAPGQPVYRAIADEIVRRVAVGELAPGARLPPVREAAAQWGVNLNTVARAYSHLAARGIVEAHAGGGTRVARAPDDGLAAARTERLRALLGEALGTALGLGYAPSEIEAAFAAQLAHWRDARRRHTARGASAAHEVAGRVVPGDEGDRGGGYAALTAGGAAGSRLVRVAGSHDLSLELLGGRLRGGRARVDLRIQPSSSLGGLFALANGDCDLAGCHLLDAESGDYNTPFVRRVLPGEAVDLVTLAEREQGLLVAAGNPRGIAGLADLARPGLRFVNRQRGSGTRVLLDRLLAAARVPADALEGYAREEPTHLAVAGAVAGGAADAGLGIRAAARALGLDFVPLARERYELAVYPATRERPAVRAMLAALRSRAFVAAVEALAGYDTRETGRIRRVE
jgi:molybdate-binding protein/DNA-binding transcriptional regulator YhcF (GntR family)